MVWRGPTKTMTMVVAKMTAKTATTTAKKMTKVRASTDSSNSSKNRRRSLSKRGPFDKAMKAAHLVKHAAAERAPGQGDVVFDTCGRPGLSKRALGCDSSRAAG